METHGKNKINVFLCWVSQFACGGTRQKWEKLMKIVV